MKKKIFAMLLVVALVLSIVPLTALAAEATVCKCGSTEWTGYVKSGEGTHAIFCKQCGAMQARSELACSSMDGKVCFWCKENMPGVEPEAPEVPEEPECKHEWKGVANNGADHNVVCRDCSEVLGAEAHKFVGGVCACGAIYVAPEVPEEPECKHEWKGVANNGADHNIVCRDCLEVLGAESHKFVGGVCACGAIYVEPAC